MRIARLNTSSCCVNATLSHSIANSSSEMNCVGTKLHGTARPESNESARTLDEAGTSKIGGKAFSPFTTCRA